MQVIKRFIQIQLLSCEQLIAFLTADPIPTQIRDFACNLIEEIRSRLSDRTLELDAKARLITALLTYLTAAKGNTSLTFWISKISLEKFNQSDNPSSNNNNKEQLLYELLADAAAINVVKPAQIADFYLSTSLEKGLFFLTMAPYFSDNEMSEFWKEELIRAPNCIILPSIFLYIFSMQDRGKYNEHINIIQTLLALFPKLEEDQRARAFLYIKATDIDKLSAPYLKESVSAALKPLEPNKLIARSLCLLCDNERPTFSHSNQLLEAISQDPEVEPLVRELVFNRQWKNAHSHELFRTYPLQKYIIVFLNNPHNMSNRDAIIESMFAAAPDGLSYVIENAHQLTEPEKALEIIRQKMILVTPPSTDSISTVKYEPQNNIRRWPELMGALQKLLGSHPDLAIPVLTPKGETNIFLTVVMVSQDYNLISRSMGLLLSIIKKRPELFSTMLTELYPVPLSTDTIKLRCGVLQTLVLRCIHDKDGPQYLIEKWKNALQDILACAVENKHLPLLFGERNTQERNSDFYSNTMSMYSDENVDPTSYLKRRDIISNIDTTSNRSVNGASKTNWANQTIPEFLRFYFAAQKESYQYVINYLLTTINTPENMISVNSFSLLFLNLFRQACVEYNLKGIESLHDIAQHMQCDMYDLLLTPSRLDDNTYPLPLLTLGLFPSNNRTQIIETLFALTKGDKEKVKKLQQGIVGEHWAFRTDAIWRKIQDALTEVNLDDTECCQIDSTNSKSNDLLYREKKPTSNMVKKLMVTGATWVNGSSKPRDLELSTMTHEPTSQQGTVPKSHIPSNK